MLKKFPGQDELAAIKLGLLLVVGLTLTSSRSTNSNWRYSAGVAAEMVAIDPIAVETQIDSLYSSVGACRTCTTT